MFGPEILARSLSQAVPVGKRRTLWQYHSQGDRHAKIACWGIVFDLLQECSVLRRHVGAGRVGFSINHEMRGLKDNRKKDLDLVLCVPNGGTPPKKPLTFTELVDQYGIILSPEERAALTELPPLIQTTVGTVQLALKAKACMTAHVGATRRLFDEMDSWQMTIGGMEPSALRVGMVMINSATEFRSPRRSKPARHRQPDVARYVVEAISRVPLCDHVRKDGYDALGVVLVECANDSVSPVRWDENTPAPQQGERCEYRAMIRSVAAKYEKHFDMIATSIA